MLNANLESIFGINMKELIRIGQQKASVTLEITSKVSLEVTLLPSKEIFLDLKMAWQAVNNSLLFSDNKKTRVYLERILNRLRRTKGDNRYRPVFDAYFYVVQNLARILNQEFEKSSIYIIPAGRAGLLEGYNSVQSALLSLSPIAPIKGISMPPISGPAAEFYKLMLRLTGKSGPMSEVAKEFETMLRGKITVKPSKVKGRLESISFNFESGEKKGSIDVIHAASGVKEVVVLYLVVKEIVSKGDFLIIEEPESHLHPEAQIRLMEIIALLVRKGIKIVLTTHSDIALRKLSQLTGVYSLSKGEDPIGINPEEFTAYLLKENKTGSIANKLAISQFGAFEQLPSFDEVIKELYNKETELQSSIQLKE